MTKIYDLDTPEEAEVDVQERHTSDTQPLVWHEINVKARNSLAVYVRNEPHTDSTPIATMPNYWVRARVHTSNQFKSNGVIWRQIWVGDYIGYVMVTLLAWSPHLPMPVAPAPEYDEWSFVDVRPVDGDGIELYRDVDINSEVIGRIAEIKAVSVGFTSRILDAQGREWMPFLLDSNVLWVLSKSFMYDERLADHSLAKENEESVTKEGKPRLPKLLRSARNAESSQE